MCIRDRLHPHIGDLVDADFHIYHQPPEIRVGSQFVEKPVVDFAAAQTFHHIITQMQRLKFCVWVIFIFRQPHQIVGEMCIRDSRYAKRYHIDYAIQKDLSCTPPRFLIFFKAQDADCLLYTSRCV